MKYVVDAHHLGAQETGNETWTRNVVRELVPLQEEPIFAVTAAGRPVLRQVAGCDGELISASATRRLAIDLPRLIRRTGAEAVLTQYTAPLTRTPVVLAVHDVSFEDPRSVDWLPSRMRTRLRTTVRWSVRRASSILVLSRDAGQRLVAAYGIDPARVVVAGCAVDPDLLRLLSSAERSPRDGLRVLVVGNVVPRKNVLTVAKALRTLIDAGEDLSLRIVGSTARSAPAELAELTAALGNRVTFTGFVDDDQLAAEYRSADIFCMPSLFEGFGIPVLEAMAAGLPVIASSATSLPEVCGDAALLCDPQDPQAWAAALRSLLDPAKRHELGRRGADWQLRWRWSETALRVHAAIVAIGGGRHA